MIRIDNKLNAYVPFITTVHSYRAINDKDQDVVITETRYPDKPYQWNEVLEPDYKWKQCQL